MTTGSVPWTRWVLFGVIACLGAGFDLTTKSYVFETIGHPGSRSVVPPILDLQTSHNEGALWGFGRTLPYSSLIFATLSVAVACAICYWLFWRGGATDPWQTGALGLIMAGAIGNCYDRLRFGYVRDFVHFHVDSIGFNCAIFNFADNMLVVGAVGLMLLALRPEPVEVPAEPAGELPAESSPGQTGAAL